MREKFHERMRNRHLNDSWRNRKYGKKIQIALHTSIPNIYAIQNGK
jgi:hypothetical protein